MVREGYRIGWVGEWCFFLVFTGLHSVFGLGDGRLFTTQL